MEPPQMQVNPYYDFENVIDSDEELDLAYMVTPEWNFCSSCLFVLVLLLKVYESWCIIYSIVL